MVSERLATAELLHELLLDPEAPVPDQRLIIEAGGPGVRHTETELLLDPLTGLPFPLAPSEHALPHNNGEVANWHHGMFPHTHEGLQTLGGRAMRCAQIQLVLRERHNHGRDAFHRAAMGPKIHSDPGHQLGMCVMAAAGATHRLAVYTEDKKIWLRPLTPQQHNQLTVHPKPALLSGEVEHFRQKKRLNIPLEEAEAMLIERRQIQAHLEYRNVRYGYDQMRDFFKEQVLAQDLSNVRRRTIRQFLDTGHPEKGLELLGVVSQELVRNTISYNGETIDTVYKRLRKAGRLNPMMPGSAAGLINHKLGDRETRESLIPDLRTVLKERVPA